MPEKDKVKQRHLLVLHGAVAEEKNRPEPFAQSEIGVN